MNVVPRIQPVTELPTPESDASVAEYVGIVLEHKRMVLAGTVLALLLGLAYVVCARPIFRTDVVLQVEKKSNGLGFEELSSMFSNEAPAETEIEIIRSRSLLGSVVDQLRLDIVAEPRLLPLLGEAVARRHEDARLARPFLGLSRFAWGGERIKVQRLEVPRHLEDEELTLLVKEGGGFDVFDDRGTLLGSGVAGQVARSHGERDGARAPEGSGFEIVVSELVARPNTRFRLMKQSWGEAVGDLQEALAVGERGRKTGVLQVSLEHPDPERLTSILDAIAFAYLRQNVERKSEEAQKTLDFIDAQLPVVKANLDAAESALNSYRSKRGTINLSLETEKMLERMVMVQGVISELEVQRAELRQRFTESHPSLATVHKKLQQLEAERSGLESKLRGLPQSELQSVRLMRDVKVSNELYLLLLNKAQELKVVKSGTIGNVRILDRALRPKDPIKPRQGIALGMSAIFGLLISIGIAFIRNSQRRGLEDPEVMERDFGLPVYASVPLSAKQEAYARAFEKGRRQSSGVLAVTDASELAVESLRSLGTSLQFALMDASNNVISISGPSPGIGKSFVSMNLAHVLADGNRRVLLIDADMRRGRLHTYLGDKREQGLSDVISGNLEFKAALRKGASPNVSFLSSGTIPPNPAELLMGERFRQLIEAASKQFDLVLIDTPPVLAVSDSAIIGRSAGVNLLVLRSGRHHVREVSAAIKRFAQNGVRMQGVIFNAVNVTGSPGSAKSNTFHYQYDYR